MAMTPSRLAAMKRLLNGRVSRAIYIDGEREPEMVEGVVVDSTDSDNEVGDNTGGREDIGLYQLPVRSQ